MTLSLRRRILPKEGSTSSLVVSLVVALQKRQSVGVARIPFSGDWLKTIQCPASQISLPQFSTTLSQSQLKPNQLPNWAGAGRQFGDLSNSALDYTEISLGTVSLLDARTGFTNRLNCEIFKATYPTIFISSISTSRNKTPKGGYGTREFQSRFY